MKTATQYKQDIKSLMDKVAGIDAKAAAENRDLNESEIKIKNEMMDTVEELNTTVKTLERQNRVREMLETNEAPATVNRNRTADAPAIDKKDKFGSLGEQLIAVVNAGRQGGSIDPRLYNAAASGLNETVGSDGGFLVQQDFVPELMMATEAASILAPKCRPQPISANANSIKINGVDETSRATGSRQGGIRFYTADEADEATKSKPKFRKIELNLHKHIGLCYLTEELLADAAALEGYIKAMFPSEAAFLVDDLIFRGSGAGEALGILNSGALVTQDKEAGQKADTIMAQNVIKMSSRIFASSYLNANWYINQMCIPELMQMSIAVGTGGQLVYVPAGGISGAPYGTLLGRPVIPIEQASALGDVGDIVLADLSGYILARKGGIRAETSLHVRFLQDEQVMKFVIRLDGQPLRATPLTPYKGTPTLSHFVALQAR
jgi:HK97 family phage major capsid protein